MSNTFECAACGRTIEKQLTDEEVEDQFKREFPDHQKAERALICEDCFHRLGFCAHVG